MGRRQRRADAGGRGVAGYAAAGLGRANGAGRSGCNRCRPRPAVGGRAGTGRGGAGSSGRGGTRRGRALASPGAGADRHLRPRRARGGPGAGPAQIRAPAAGPVRNLRPARLAAGDGRNAGTHPRRGRIADVGGELLHRAVRRRPRGAAVPVLRRPVRPLAVRSGRRDPARHHGHQPDRGHAARWQGAPRQFGVGAPGAQDAARYQPGARQRSLAGGADAPGRGGERRDRGAELRPRPQLFGRGPGAAGIRGPAHPHRRRPPPGARGTRAPGRRADPGAAAGQRGAAGGDHRAPAFGAAAAGPVPDQRAVGDGRQPGALPCGRARPRGRPAVCAELLRGDALGRWRAHRVPILGGRARSGPDAARAHQGTDRIRDPQRQRTAGGPRGDRSPGTQRRAGQPRRARAQLAGRAAGSGGSDGRRDCGAEPFAGHPL